jgi:ParB family transcriptional regulator, chromosome partitioning protein
MSVNKKKEIGKGISALLGNITEEVTTFKNVNIPAITKEVATTPIGTIAIDKIVVNPKQPRRDFDKDALQALSDSIKLHGIIQPITVIEVGDNQYQLISGERRWRASKLAGLTVIPAYIRSANNQAQIELALLENLQREDLNAIEIALSYQVLMDECTLTHEEVADRMHKSRTSVTNHLRLLKLPPTIQQAVRDGQLSMGHARSLLGIEHIEQQLYAFNETLSKELSVRQTEQLVNELKKDKKAKVSSKIATKELPPAYKRIQDQMSSKLSTKVLMSRKANGAGSLNIDFYSDTDLERIMAAIGI